MAGAVAAFLRSRWARPQPLHQQNGITSELQSSLVTFTQMMMAVEWPSVCVFEFEEDFQATGS
jgi:hypothetical protein